MAKSWAEMMAEDDAHENLDKPQIREAYVRAPFAWPGCKTDSLLHIIPNLPKAKVYVEGCGGSGAVLLNLPNHYPLKVFNDRHAGITCFFRCLKDPEKVKAVKAWLEKSIHSREEFIWCRDSWQDASSDVERAARWYYMLRTSFASLGRNWGRSTSGTAQQGQAMLNNLDLFETLHPRLRNVQIENLDVNQIITDYDSGDTVFYLDPDYIGTDPSIYVHRVQHERMLELIGKARGYFAVSGYRNELYDSMPWWTEIKEWQVKSSMRPQAFTDSNNLEGKQNVMTRDRFETEVLYIKDFQ